MSSYFVHCQEVQLCLYCSLFAIGAQSVFLGQPGLSVPTHLYGQAVFTESVLCQRGSQIFVCDQGQIGLSLSFSLSLSPLSIPLSPFLFFPLLSSPSALLLSHYSPLSLSLLSLSLPLSLLLFPSPSTPPSPLPLSLSPSLSLSLTPSLPPSLPP